DISLEPTVDLGAVWTDPASSGIKEVYQIVCDVTGKHGGYEPRTAPYFTDASALTPAFGNPPTIILGPGEAAKAHQTDEYCSVERIRDASDVYSRLAARWAGTSE